MFKAKTKKWGNSTGIIIPKSVLSREHIKPNEEVIVEITKKKTNVLKELFGALPFSRPTEEILEEARRDLESKY